MDVVENIISMKSFDFKKYVGEASSNVLALFLICFYYLILINFGCYVLSIKQFNSFLCVELKQVTSRQATNKIIKCW